MATAIRYCKHCRHPQEIDPGDDRQIPCRHCARFAPAWAWLLVDPLDEPQSAQTPQIAPDDVCADCGKPGTYLSHSTPDKNGICYECERQRVERAENIPAA